MNRTLYIIFFLILLNGCATSYTLAPRYEESLGDNKYEISFRGNSYTSEDKLKNYFNKRAAKLCESTSGNFIVLKQKTEAVDMKDRTYADIGKSIDMELRVIGVVQCQ